ncbi:hypothetical protein E2C01_019040 [Portunus trituberculatus]|uniref:Uncharacterized protein n=1 Tax=Portunus trituberculatus TaxID=210409 RepID=A0A5B7DY37_PORTR|nr:hypothetical protein [Portunus trituberculatus]
MPGRRDECGETETQTRAEEYSGNAAPICYPARPVTPRGIVGVVLGTKYSHQVPSLSFPSARHAPPPRTAASTTFSLQLLASPPSSPSDAALTPSSRDLPSTLTPPTHHLTASSPSRLAWL